MGIGLKNQDWRNIVAKNRAEDIERVKKGMRPRFACQTYDNPEYIKVTEAGAAYIAAHISPRDEEGNLVTSTERGKRRRIKNGK